MASWQSIELALADWLEELAVYGTARRPQDAETAHHLSEAIKYWRLVRLAIEPVRPTKLSMRSSPR